MISLRPRFFIGYVKRTTTGSSLVVVILHTAKRMAISGADQAMDITGADRRMELSGADKKMTVS